MKLSYRDIDAQVKNLSPQYQAVLIYGPDEGLVRERATKIAKQVVEDLQDPFLVANLDPDTLKKEPGQLADEVAAISMMGEGVLFAWRGPLKMLLRPRKAF